MNKFIKKIKDTRLNDIINTVKLGDANQFKKIQEKFSEYDISFLWLLCYPKEGNIKERAYIEKSYEKFFKYLDSDFPRKLASKGNFDSRMWEMILCDILSSSGRLKEKGEARVDFILESNDKQLIQIEAVAPNEADEKKLQSVKPGYTGENIFELSGNIEDLERPILLRVFDKGFIQKAEKNIRKIYLLLLQ